MTREQTMREKIREILDERSSNAVKQEAILALHAEALRSGEASDGYHTFNELYEHRHALFMALQRQIPERSWKSKLHSDGSSLDGWFIAGIETEKGKQITYHLPLSKWGECTARELERGPGVAEKGGEGIAICRFPRRPRCLLQRTSRADRGGFEMKITAKHAIITDQCRTNRTDSGAIDEALQRIGDEARVLLEYHKRGVKLHFKLEIEIEEALHE